MLLLVWLLISLSVSHGQNNDVTITPNLNHGGVGFVHLESITLSQYSWRLSLDYDLSQHTKIITSLRSNVADLWSKLSDVRIQSLNKDIMEFNSHVKDFLKFELNMLTQSITSLESQLGDIKQSIKPSHSDKRHKRAVINLGPGLSYLFGVASDDELTKLNNKVNEQSEQNNQLIHLVEHQCTVIANVSANAIHTALQLDHLSNATNHMAIILESLSAEYSQDINELARKLSVSMKISSSVRSIEAILSTARDRLSFLQQAWSDTANGKLSQFFLHPTEFLTALKEIAIHLPAGYQFLIPPEAENLYSFYEFTSVVAALLDHERIRFFLNVPISNVARKYHLFSCHSLPILRSTSPTLFSYIQPESSHLAVSYDLKSFIPLNAGDLLNCHGTAHKICDTQLQLRSHPEYTCSIAAYLGRLDLTSKLCKTIITGELNPLFINAPGSNTWLYFVPKQSRISITCPDENNNLVSSQTVINGSGTLTLKPHCEGQLGGHTLISRLVGSSAVHFNNSIKIHLPDLKNLNSVAYAEISGTEPTKLTALHALINSTFPPLAAAIQKIVDSPSGLPTSLIDQLELLSMLDQNQKASVTIWPSAFSLLSLGLCSSLLLFLGLRFYIVAKAVKRKKSQALGEAEAYPLR